MFIFNRELNLGQDTELGATPNTGQSWLLDQGGPGTIVTQCEGWSISPVTPKYHVTLLFLLDCPTNRRHQAEILMWNHSQGHQSVSSWWWPDCSSKNGCSQPVPAHRYCGFIRFGSLEYQGRALAGRPFTAEDTQR